MVLVYVTFLLYNHFNGCRYNVYGCGNGVDSRVLLSLAILSQHEKVQAQNDYEKGTPHPTNDIHQHFFFGLFFSTTLPTQ
jgi:hypothetical protein